MVYQVYQPDAGSTEAILRGLPYDRLELATLAANALMRDEEIRIELSTGGMSYTVLVLAKV